MQLSVEKNLIFMGVLLFLLAIIVIHPAPLAAQANLLTMTKINSMIQEYVSAQSAPDETIEIVIKSVPTRLPEASGEWRVSCRKTGKISGKTVFALTSDKGNVRPVQVVAEVKVFMPVYVLNKSVNRHHVIQHSDLDPVIQEITWPSTEYAVSVHEAAGKRTTRQIAAGRALTSAMLETIPVVERGDYLSMHVLDKNLHVEIPVVSHGQGYNGQIIKVRNATTDAYYLAEIKDKKTVIYKSTKR